MTSKRLIIKVYKVRGSSYLIMKSAKQSTKKVFSESVVKAHLIGMGSGTLEFIDNTIKFHIETGRLRKRRELSREIPMSDIEEINRVGKELSITWKGSIDIFVIEKIDLVGTIFEKIPMISEEQKKLFDDKKVVKQQRFEINNVVSITMEITDLLFDILRSLHGWVDWNRIENLLEKSIKKAEELTDQKSNLLELDFSKLILAVKERFQEEISKETFNLLKLLYYYFVGINSEDETPEKNNPDYFDVKTTIQAYYLLNDIVLGSIIGDEEIGKEQKELLMMLEDLAKSTNLKININSIQTVICKLCDEKGKENVIEESRMLFRQQLSNLITD